MAHTPCPGPSADVGRPSIGMAAVVRERRDRLAEASVPGPPVGHSAHAAKGSGDRGDARKRGDRVRAVVGSPGVTPLGQDLGGVDLSGSRQRGEGPSVGALGEVGRHGTVEALLDRAESAEHSDQGDDGVASGLGPVFVHDARRGRAQAPAQSSRDPAPPAEAGLAQLVAAQPRVPGNAPGIAGVELHAGQHLNVTELGESSRSASDGELASGPASLSTQTAC